MSTKTTFKRIALVAVAALGLGVLSVAPSSAAASGVAISGVTGVTTTLRAGSTNTVDSDTSTAATFTVSGLFTDLSDTATVQIFEKSRPVAATTANTVRIAVADTSTANTAVTSGGTAVRNWYRSNFGNADTITAGGSFKINASTAGNVGATFGIYLDTLTAAYAGAYVYSIAVTTSSTNGGTITSTTTTSDVTITVAAGTAASLVASAAYSTLGDPSSSTAVATVSTTAAAASTLSLVLKNASQNTTAAESVTATITGPGSIGDGTVNGKSVILKYSGSSLTLNVYADGTAGVSTINVSTPSVTFAPKTVTFYAKSPKTITAATYNPVLNVGPNLTAVAATAVDANGTNWAGQLYIVASSATDALVGGSATAPVPCKYDPTTKTHFCPVTVLTVGTAKLKVIDQTLALGTETAYGAAMTAATSNEVSVTSSIGVPTTVKLAFDKATYQPFEKAIITVTPLDSAGNKLGAKTVSNIFATGGISSNIAFGSQSDTLTAVSLTTSADSSATAPRTAGSYTYAVYMPAQGTVTITATGGTGLATAGQVAVTASATVVNSSVDAATDAANEATDAANAATDAALAAADAADAATAAAQDASDAVAALSASVEKLVASLKAQLTSLTNLVIKIQKKVKA